MSQINSSKLIGEIIQGAKTNIVIERVPNQLAEKVVPVMEVNPKLFRVVDIVKQDTCNDAVATTLYTTPTDKDFYLVGCSISFCKDVTSTSVGSSIRAIINGVSQKLIEIRGITLQVQEGQDNITFPTPIKVDRGTAISVNNSASTATITTSGTIFGYTVED